VPEGGKGNLSSTRSKATGNHEKIGKLEEIASQKWR
jgi:hypothetical protein